MNEPRFTIGQIFKPVGKTYLCTVTDVLKTTNSRGELVAVRYVATHDFMGQCVTDSNVLETTIARGLVS